VGIIIATNTNQINIQQSIIGVGTINNNIAEQIRLISLNNTLFKQGVIDESERDKINRLINNDYQISHS